MVDRSDLQTTSARVYEARTAAGDAFGIVLSYPLLLIKLAKRFKRPLK